MYFSVSLFEQFSSFENQWCVTVRPHCILPVFIQCNIDYYKYGYWVLVERNGLSYFKRITERRGHDFRQIYLLCGNFSG